MIALLLAAQVAAAATPLPKDTVPGRFPSWSNPQYLKPVPRACRQGVTVASGPPFAPGFHKLADLPKPHLEIAVERSVGGCPAPIVVRYDVQGDGRAASGGSGR